MNKALQGLISYITGRQAEEKAYSFLKKKGFVLETRNFRPQKGSGANELDLIMWDKKTLVFIEVKKRNTLTEAAEVVDNRLQKRLFKGAQTFLALNPQYEKADCRFDVVLILQNENVVHLQNVIEG